MFNSLVKIPKICYQQYTLVGITETLYQIYMYFFLQKIMAILKGSQLWRGKCKKIWLGKLLEEEWDRKIQIGAGLGAEESETQLVRFLLWGCLTFQVSVDMRKIPPLQIGWVHQKKFESLYSASKIKCFLLEIAPIYVCYKTLWSNFVECLCSKSQLVPAWHKENLK